MAVEQLVSIHSRKEDYEMRNSIINGDYKDPTKIRFGTVSEMKEWAKTAETVRYDGVSIVAGISELENLPLLKEVEMAKALNEITGNSVLLLPRRMNIEEYQGAKRNQPKSPDGINAISEGRTVEFKRTGGSWRTIRDFITDAFKKSDDAFAVITSLKPNATIGKIINSVTASLRQNKGSVGDHKAVFVDVQNQRALVYDIKKETSGEVSASGRGLDEYNPRSRTVYLNDTLIPRIVNAGEIEKIEFNAYASAHYTQELHSLSNQCQTMDADK